MIYVFPHCARKEAEIEKIKGISRLYAYPCLPRFENEAPLTILDSGAYALSQKGGKMGITYMEKLSQHYAKYYTNKSLTLCIAPDEFLNPVQSMLNFRAWQKKHLFSNITAVIQAESKNRIDMQNLKYQADFYRKFTDTACFSNNNLTNEEAKLFKLEELFKYMKKLGYKWIHVLGAGWSIDDILEWKKIKYFDSMDSIAYYSTKDIEAFGSLDPIQNIRRISECFRT